MQTLSMAQAMTHGTRVAPDTADSGLSE